MKPVNGAALGGGPTELEKRLEQARGGLEVELGKLSPEPGDVVVVRFPADTPEKFMRPAANYISSVLSPIGVRWIGLAEGVELEHVSEAEMAKLGWVRPEPAKDAS